MKKLCLIILLLLGVAIPAREATLKKPFKWKSHKENVIELTLTRTYYKDGTNGELRVGKYLLCYTIELPWNENKFRASCIPEGCYRIEKRWHKKYGWHFYVLDVPDRVGILIHRGQDAQKDLKGCIAPTMELTYHGKGKDTFEANKILHKYLLKKMDSTTVYLKINSIVKDGCDQDTTQWQRY